MFAHTTIKNFVYPDEHTPHFEDHWSKVFEVIYECNFTGKDYLPKVHVSITPSGLSW